jgi:hypothetical protein
MEREQRGNPCMDTYIAKIMISKSTKIWPHKHALFMIPSSNMYFHIAALE